MNSKAPILQVNDLCVDFKTRQGGVRVLDSVEFDLKPAEAVGIVGESGCGKSMTAFAIMGLVPQPNGQVAGGQIYFEDQDLLGFSEAQMERIRGNKISMIFQEPMTSLNPVFTVGYQILENIRRHQQMSRSQAREVALDMLRAVRIPAAKQRLRQYPHELSGGMRQRAMIAMALSCQPKILVADEPTTALDVTVQAQIFDLLKDIQEKMGTAVILITHDMGVIAEFAQRVIVMYAGRKVEEGSVRQIITNPQHPYTQGLLKCIPHYKKDPGQTREKLTEIPGTVPDLSQLGSGCHFAMRCSFQIEKCLHERPPSEVMDTDHTAACWRAGVTI